MPIKLTNKHTFKDKLAVYFQLEGIFKKDKKAQAQKLITW